MAQGQPSKSGFLVGGFRIGRLLGIDVLVDWSLLIIFTLITFNLAAFVFPIWHPNWNQPLNWVIAGVASLLFFASILAHEMSHALVARRYDMQVNRITLFVFGGMAHLESEPKTPKAEFFMAAAGPLASLLIGIAAVLLGLFLAGDALRSAGDDAERLFRQIGPMATLMLWLGPINIILGVFNMLPGFPLDGGRVFRSILWGVTGSYEIATRWASRTGQAMAFLMMGYGGAMALGIPMPLFGAGLLQGIWFLLIGWFLYQAARMSYRQLQMRQSLSMVAVADLMQTHLDTVSPEMLVADLVRFHIMHSDQMAFPVLQEDRLVGVVSVDAVGRLSPAERSQTTVFEIMTPKAELAVLRPEDNAFDALQQLSSNGSTDLPVLADGNFQGMVRKKEINRWLAMHHEPQSARRP